MAKWKATITVESKTRYQMCCHLFAALRQIVCDNMNEFCDGGEHSQARIKIEGPPEDMHPLSTYEIEKVRTMIR